MAHLAADRDALHFLAEYLLETLTGVWPKSCARRSETPLQLAQGDPTDARSVTLP
jgi:hypothetical protein